VKWPCFYGIDFATRAELIANGLAVDEIRQSVGADSLTYISLEDLVEATTIPVERLCTACFTGEYPIELPAPEALGKHLLEGYERDSTSTAAGTASDADGLASLTAATGASDALGRP
jgi:amidophosphoribosyltransferase